MARLEIHFSRKGAGDSVLRCVRADGTETWQRRPGEFFALHDLTHWALESVLGVRYGFYGLLADGWNITDFGAPWPKGPIPAYALDDAMFAEWLAGLLDQERGTGHTMDASGYNLALASMAEAAGYPAPRLIIQAQLDRIREVFQEAAFAWRMLSPGTTLTKYLP